jgi:hypothetical protein
MSACEYFGRAINIFKIGARDPQLVFPAKPDAETAALLRAMLDEVCAGISPFDSVTRTHVASSLLEKTRQPDSSLDDLRQAAITALRRPPTMWR